MLWIALEKLRGWRDSPDGTEGRRGRAGRVGVRVGLSGSGAPRWPGWPRLFDLEMRSIGQIRICEVRDSSRFLNAVLGMENSTTPQPNPTTHQPTPQSRKQSESSSDLMTLRRRNAIEFWRSTPAVMLQIHEESYWIAQASWTHHTLGLPWPWSSIMIYALLIL